MHRKTSKNESKNSQPSYDAELEAVKKLAAELEKNERYPLRKKTLISYSDNDNKNFRSDKKKKKRRAKQPAIPDLEQQPVEVTEYDEHNNEVDVTKYDGHDNEGEETTHNNRLIKIDDDGSDSNPVVAELAPEDDIKIQEFHIPKNPEGLPQIIPMPSQSTETMMDLSFLKPMQPVNIFPIQHPNIFLTPTPAYCNIPFHSQELKFPFNPLSGYLSPPITQFNMGYVTPHNLYQDILNRKFQKQNTMNILFNNL